jgi:hypothetical protein
MFYLNATEFVCLAATTIALVLTAEVLLEAYRDCKALRDEGANGARLMIAGWAIRHEWFRVGKLVIILAMVCAGVWLGHLLDRLSVPSQIVEALMMLRYVRDIGMTLVAVLLGTNSYLDLRMRRRVVDRLTRTREAIMANGGDPHDC